MCAPNSKGGKCVPQTLKGGNVCPKPQQCKPCLVKGGEGGDLVKVLYNGFYYSGAFRNFCICDRIAGTLSAHVSIPCTLILKARRIPNMIVFNKLKVVSVFLTQLPLVGTTYTSLCQPITNFPNPYNAQQQLSLGILSTTQA